MTVKEKRPDNNSLERTRVDKALTKRLQDEILRLPKESHRIIKHQRNPIVRKQSRQLHAQLIRTKSIKNHGGTRITTSRTGGK